MPRRARLDAPGTLHHVIVRRIEKRKIVDDDQDVITAPIISYGIGNSGGYSANYWWQYGMYSTTFHF